jgi:hypothetical protein
VAALCVCALVHLLWLLSQHGMLSCVASGTHVAGSSNFVHHQAAVWRSSRHSSSYSAQPLAQLSKLVAAFSGVVAAAAAAAAAGQVQQPG